MSKTITLKKNAAVETLSVVAAAVINGTITTVDTGTPPWTVNADTPQAVDLEGTDTGRMPAPVAAPVATPDGLGSVALETTDYVEQGNFKAALKGATKQAGAIMLARDQIHIAPGFNVRAESPDYLARVESIGRSMHADGWLVSKPVEVFVNAAGQFVPTDGHTRLRAYDYAVANLGTQIESIPVVVTTGMTMADMTVGLVKQNEGRPLLPVEKAVVCLRLSKWGWDNAKIADRLDMTPRYVSELLGLLAAPEALVALVKDGTVSASTAMQAIKDDGAAAAAAAIVPAAVAAKKAGKRVTAGTLKKAQALIGGNPAKPAKVEEKPAKAASAAKKVNPADVKHDPMDVLRAVFNDPGFNKLSDAVQTMVLAIAT